MTPVLESFTPNSSTGSLNNNVVLTKPTGVVSGDLLVLIAANDSTTPTLEFSDNLTGWSFLGASGGSSPDAHIGVFYRVSDGTEASTVTINPISSQEWTGYYLRISNASGIDAFNFSATGSASVSHVISALTTTVPNTLAIYGISYDGGDGSPFTVSGTGWAEDSEAVSGTGGGNSSAFGSKGVALAGTTGDATVTASASDGSAWFQLAIAPAAGGGFDDQRQPILDGLVSGDSGLDALLAAIPVGNVVRTSDTVVTITVPPLTGLLITADQDVVPTIPADALEIGFNPIVSTSFEVTDVAAVIELTGTATGTSSVTGDIDTGVLLGGLVTGTSSASGALLTGVTLDGSVTGTSSASGDLEVGVLLEGTDTGTSSSSGDLTTGIELSGTVTGTSSSTAAFEADAVLLAGTITGTSSSSGDLITGIELVGTSTSTSSASGDVTTGAELGGTVTGTSSATAALTIGLTFAGTLTGTAIATGALSAGANMEGTVTGTSSTSGALSSGSSVSGTITGASSVSGDLTTGVELGGTSTSTSSGSGVLVTVAAELSGASTSLSSASGVLLTGIELEGTVSGTSSVTASLDTGEIFLEGISLGSSQMYGRLITGLVASVTEHITSQTSTSVINSETKTISVVSTGRSNKITSAKL